MSKVFLVKEVFFKKICQLALIFQEKDPAVAILLKRSFKNGAHESLYISRIFSRISLLVPAFLGFKERISFITSFIFKNFGAPYVSYVAKSVFLMSLKTFS